MSARPWAAAQCRAVRRESSLQAQHAVSCGSETLPDQAAGSLHWTEQLTAWRPLQEACQCALVGCRKEALLSAKLEGMQAHVRLQLQAAVNAAWAAVCKLSMFACHCSRRTPDEVGPLAACVQPTCCTPRPHAPAAETRPVLQKCVYVPSAPEQRRCAVMGSPHKLGLHHCLPPARLARTAGALQ